MADAEIILTLAKVEKLYKSKLKMLKKSDGLKNGGDMWFSAIPNCLWSCSSR